MSTDESAVLLAAKTRVLAAYGTWLATSRGGKVLQTREFVLCAGGFASPYRNTAVLLTPLAEPQIAALREQVNDFYGDMPWALWDCLGHDLTGAGLRNSSPQCLLMARPPEVAQKAGPRQALVIREAQSDEDVRAFERVRELANGRPADVSSGGYLDARSLGPDHRLWLGLLEGTPVASAASFRSAGYNLVKNVATVPEVRGRGIGLAMSARAVSAGGYALLDTQKPTADLYRRLGFQEFGRLQTWRPAESPDGRGWIGG